MQVVNINQSSAVNGGSDAYWKSLSNLLRKNGHTVEEYYSLGSDCASESDARVYPRNIDLAHPELSDVFKFFYNTEAANKLKKFVHNKDIDLAHLHIYYGKLTSSILGVLRQEGIPIVQTLHEYKIVCPVYTMFRDDKVCYECAGNRFFNGLLNRCNKGSLARSLASLVESYISVLFGSQTKIDRYITVSDFQRQLISDMGFDTSKMTTIHNFIEDSNFDPVDATAEYFLYFGRIEKIKGIDVIIQVARRLPNINFILAGDGAYLVEAKSKAKELKLENVTFVGRKSKAELSGLISKSFAVLVPSVWAETFGLVILEAFACARPVIVSRIGGMSEVVRDGIDGFLVEAGSVSALEEKVKYLYSRPSVSLEMGRRGLEQQQTVFSKEEHYRKVSSLYQSVLG